MGNYRYLRYLEANGSYGTVTEIDSYRSGSRGLGSRRNARFVGQ